MWYVAHPYYTYWTASQDFENTDLSASVVLFRAAIRADGGIAPTLEPGVSVTLDAAPGAIQLRQDPAEQVAWQEASLLVESAVDQSRDAIISILEDSSSPTGSAVIACVSTAYDIGRGLANQDPSAAEITLELAGINQSSQECGKKINEAQEALREAGRPPELTLGEVTQETHSDSEWTEAGHAISDDLERFGDDILKLHD